MTLDDLTCVEITEVMRQVAQEASNIQAENIGKNTRFQMGDVDRNKGDIIGSLGEQVVDIAGKNLVGDYFKSFHAVKGSFGDPYDHAYEDDRIDTKTTRGDPHNKYATFQQFKVIKSTADKIASGEKNITHYCFVLIDREKKDHACIYGVIRVGKFMQLAHPRTLEYENYEIEAKHLTPFVDYVYRTH